MNIEKQVVSLELAKKLKELGVKQESLFWYVADSFEDAARMKWRDIPVMREFCFRNYQSEDKTLSAFTVAELGEMLPSGALGAYLNIFKNIEGTWRVGYGLEVTLIADTEADARAKMLIYLLENNLIK